MTLVIVECVDRNNEVFANRDSVRPLRGLWWGLTLPEDIASNQEGKYRESEKKRTGMEMERVPECVTNHFLSQTNVRF